MIKNKIRLLLLNNEGYVYVIVAIVIILSVIYCGITLYKPLAVRDDIFHITSVIVHEIEEEGEITDEIEIMIQDLCTEMNISPTISFDGNFILSSRSTRIIQIREPFYVDVELVIPIELMDPMFSSPVTVDITIKKRLKGVGQVYWRPSEM